MRKHDHTKKWQKLHALNCHHKIRYATYELALVGAIAYRKKWGTFMKVYQCYHCHFFHIGHRL